MNGESANKFISALVKSLQTLCHGYVEFNDGIEIIGHLYLNIDSGSSFDYIVKEKVCKNAESGTIFVSKSFQAHSPPGEVISRRDKDDETVFDDSSMSPTTGTHRIQSAITNISNVLSGQPGQKSHPSHHLSSNSGKRKRDHGGSYSIQPGYKYTTLQSSSSSGFFNNASSSKQGDRNHPEHFNNSSHAEFFGGDSNQGSGMGADEEDDLDLDVTFVKEEYQRNSGQRVASRLSQDQGSSQSNVLHEGQLSYPPNHSQAPQQFASGTAGDLSGMSQNFQDPSQLELGQQPVQGPPNPRNNVSGTNGRRPTFRVPAVPVKIFRCPVCGIAIRHKNNIKRHMRRHNDPAAQGNVDVTKTWAQHFVTAPAGSHLHEGRIGRTYNCPICGLIISHRKNIRRHMRKHTGEMFFCDMCDWRGTCRWKMQKHRERKHNSPVILQQDSPSLVQLASPLIHNSSPSLVQHSSPSLVQHSSPSLVQHAPPLVQPLQHNSSLLQHGSLNSKADELCS